MSAGAAASAAMPADLDALEALRDFAHAYQESAHLLADWMSLPRTDGVALGEVVWAERRGAPLSPARLSTRIGLTSGATTALVDRLEAKGLLQRSRESADRRIVTLRATAAAIERLDPLLVPASARLHMVVAEADDAALRTLAELARTIASILPRAEDAERPGRDAPEVVPGAARRVDG